MREKPLIPDNESARSSPERIQNSGTKPERSYDDITAIASLVCGHLSFSAWSMPNGSSNQRASTLTKHPGIGRFVPMPFTPPTP